MLHVPYTSQLFREDDSIVALCPELNVSSFGATPEEALSSLQEAVALFIETCQEMGTLEMVLEEAGYRRDAKVPDRWLLPQPFLVKQFEVSVAQNHAG